jgi:Toprim-like/CHC2 zinc finger
MTIRQAQQIPLSAVLSRLGYSPVKTYKGGVELAYKSPFRAESTPSFFVNVVKNVWNDFGDSGGTVLDFVMRLQNTDVRGALAFLDTLIGAQFLDGAQEITPPQYFDAPQAETLVLEQIKPFGTSITLKDYIVQKRKIGLAIANFYLKEAHFKNQETKKNYFAAAFENNAGGFEIRNPFFKSALNGKDMSFRKGQNAATLAVFEGFIDFLSFLSLQKSPIPPTDILVLNSIVFREKAAQFINEQNYATVEMWLNNDKSGKETLHYIIENTNASIVPQNHLYLDFNDLNEYLVFNAVKKTF